MRSSALERRSTTIHFLVLTFCLLPCLKAFSVNFPANGFHRQSFTSLPSNRLHLLPPNFGSDLLLSVDVFDGSSIVDPVVVSSSFWNTLQRQIISVILGQVLAAIVFTVVASFFASQLSNFRDFFVLKFLSETPSFNNKEFIKADSPKYYERVTQKASVSPDYGKLLICLAIDLIGSSSELIPILGEFTDILTAPIAATLLQNLFGGSKIIFFFELTEEILPFTDIIPFATLCWVVDTYFPDSDIASVFQLGQFNAKRAEQNAIDTTAETLEPPGRNVDRNSEK